MDRTDRLVAHYTRVAEVPRARRELLRGKISDAYVEAVLLHLEHWVEAGRKGYLAWGERCTSVSLANHRRHTPPCPLSALLEKRLDPTRTMKRQNDL